MLKLLFILGIIIISSITNYQLECSDAGSCSITYSSNQKLMIGPGIIPINPEKFIVPFKVGTVSADPPSNINIAQYNELESMNSYLDGSNYQCADGLGECKNACCYKGKCVDPSNVCREFSSLSHMIIILVTIAFGFLILIYWIAFYYLGVRHNTSNPNDDKDLYLRRTEIPNNREIRQQEVIEEVQSPHPYNPNWQHQRKEDQEIKMESPNVPHLNLRGSEK
jgi:hypothetical protein